MPNFRQWWFCITYAAVLLSWGELSRLYRCGQVMNFTHIITDEEITKVPFHSLWLCTVLHCGDGRKCLLLKKIHYIYSKLHEVYQAQIRKEWSLCWEEIETAHNSRGYIFTWMLHYVAFPSACNYVESDHFHVPFCSLSGQGHFRVKRLAGWGKEKMGNVCF